jgi:DNA-binding NarL/FixJ family response regulator
MKPIRVLCVDDHPLIRDGIVFTLHKEPDITVVADAENGVAAVAAYQSHSPDITLIDLHMPRLDGIEALARIRILDPAARCIVFTTYESDAQAWRALKAGAMGYLLKTMIRTKLVDAIRTVHSGCRYIPNEVAAEIAQHIGLEELTAREIEVLRNVADGYSNKLIAARLRISENTVKGHMKSIVAKLQANDRTHAVTLAQKRGYLNA